MKYIACLHKESSSDYGVSFFDFPGCITAGHTPEEAQIHAQEALELHIAGMIEDGQMLPEPSPLDAVFSKARMEGGTAFIVEVAESMSAISASTKRIV